MASVEKIVIDECHCIPHWGPDFRPTYKLLGNLRAIFPVPILATTATLPSHYREEVLTTLLFNEKKLFSVNLGNERPNIKLDLRIMKGTKKDPLPDFADIFEEAAKGNIRKRMIFIDDRLGTQTVAELIIAQLPDAKKSQVAFYHSEVGTQTKKVLMDKFVKGEVRVLVSTEAAGMVRTFVSIIVERDNDANAQGCDIRDVEEVIRYGAPSSVSVLMQQLGRAGRDPTIWATGVVILEASVFQYRVIPKPKSKKSKSKAKGAGSAPASGDETGGSTDSEGDEGGKKSKKGKGKKGKGKRKKKDAPPQVDFVHLEPPEGFVWVKRIDVDVRRLYVCNECRRQFLSRYFGNPATTTTGVSHRRREKHLGDY